MPFWQKTASLGIETMERLVARVRVLREVAIDRDSTASRALIDMVLEVLTIALAVNVLKELLPMMNGYALEWDVIAALEANFGSDRFKLHDTLV